MSVKFNKAALAALVAFGLAANMANAADQGHGKVTFTGSVVDAPCSIHPDSLDQTIPLGQISNASLKKGGTSTTRPFYIKLENCTFGTPATKNKVTVTFTGSESDAVAGLLATTGQAKGVAVAITDNSGGVVKLGKPTKARELQNGNNTLNFGAYVQGTANETVAITEGDFQSVADFTLAYN
ncbi:fimbrial protein [Serratia ficaria]|uniref:fimbrial protein n=1 Tax=Serratia ficaria TaxID=61651 RepID=UPI002177995E|nr:fimbrial protein [Serratia ficaria]CAI1508423.1 Major MR/P fimbria protein precursor [Serratia ficaria]